MRTTRQLSITLPNDMADEVRGRVESGAYASESEVIRDGLRALFARDQAVEDWLRTEVAEAFDGLMDGSAETFSVDAVRSWLSARHAARS